MTDLDFSVDSLDLTLGMKAGEVTLGFIAESLNNSKCIDLNFSENLNLGDLDKPQKGDTVQSDPTFRYDVSQSHKDSACHPKPFTSCNANILDFYNEAAAKELSSTVDKILAGAGGVKQKYRAPDLPYIGVPAHLGEMLLQHGEFPATPTWVTEPRFQSTPVQRASSSTESSAEFSHNHAFNSASMQQQQQQKQNEQQTKLQMQQEQQQEQHQHSKRRKRPIACDLTYGMSLAGQSGENMLYNSCMLITPENFHPNTPKFSLGGLNQVSVSSLPSFISWETGEGERLYPSPVSSCQLSTISMSSEVDTPPELEDLQCPLWSKYQSRDCRLMEEENSCNAREVKLRRNSIARWVESLSQDQKPLTLSWDANPSAYASQSFNKEEKEEKKLSSRKSILQTVVLAETTRAFRSHPLFPLLKHLVVAEYYFNKGAADIVPLLIFLPTSSEDMIAHFKERHNIQDSKTQVDAVITDAIIYAHACLLEKVRLQAAEPVTLIKMETVEAEAVVNMMCENYISARTSTPLETIDNGSGRCTMNSQRRNSLKELECQIDRHSPIMNVSIPSSCHFWDASKASRFKTSATNYKDNC